MWNPFKKSSKGSDIKSDRHSSSTDVNNKSVTCRLEDRPTPSHDGDMKVDAEIASAAGAGTPSKVKAKRKLSLFGSKSRGKTSPSDNVSIPTVTGNDCCINGDGKRKPEAAITKTNGVKADVDRHRAVDITTPRVDRIDPEAHRVDGVDASVADKRQSAMSNGSADSSMSVVEDGINPATSRNSRSSGRHDISDCNDDDDEVFHRRPVVLSTFAATASVDVVAKPSPPKMKRRAKSSTGSGHMSETETRRSKLSKPSTSSVNRPKVEPVQMPTVPTSSPSSSGANETKTSCPQSATGNTSSANGSGVKRVPPPVPVRRSSNRNGSSDLLSPSRDPVSCGPAPNVGGPRTLYSVSSMRSSPGDSGSDDTEGKESGYVTLDDIQAQLMRSSWSSDDREVEQATSRHVAVTDDRLPATSKGLTDSLCSSAMSRMMTPDSLMTSSQTSTTLSYPLTTVNPDDDDEDVSWPAPPPPLDHPAAASLEDGKGKAGALTTSCISQDDAVPPVVTLTFTVKLDGDLIKNKSRGQQTATSITSDISFDDSTQPTTPLCDPSPRSAVVIPDVVICAGASTMAASVDGNSCPQVARTTAASTSVVAVVDARCRLENECCVKESRSCQTEPGDGYDAKCMTCSSHVSQKDVPSAGQLSANNNGREQPEAEKDDVIGDGAQRDASCQCRCRVDDGSYLRPLVTRVYASKSSPKANARCEPTASGIVAVCQNAEELTHMNWNEVMAEAHTMGIDLHPPQVTTCRYRRQLVADCNHSPSIKSCHSSNVDLESMTCRSPVRRRLLASHDFDEQLEIIENLSTVNVVIATDGDNNSKKAAKTSSFRDIFRWPSKLFSSKKSTTSKPVKRSKSLEQPYRVQGRNLPAPPSNKMSHRRSENMNEIHNRLSCSRYSASSCPSTSIHTTGRPAAPSRTISVPASSSRSAQSSSDYFIGSSCGGSSGIGAHGGSLPAFHRHRVTSSSTCTGDQLMTSSFDAADLIEACCISPSVNSFSGPCSHTAPWRHGKHGSPSTSVNATSAGGHTSSGLFSSLSSRCASWKGNKTDFVSSLSELQNYGWYWGALGFDEAEEKLAQRRDGSFLVRDSSDERYILSLSFRSLGSTHHTRIEHYKGSFSFCSQFPPIATNLAPASTIVEFIEGAMAASRSGQCLYYLRPRAPGFAPAPVRLLYPVSRFRCMHSLQHLCKFAVLRHVRLDMVDRLPVPPRLKEYLKHGRPTMD